MLRWNWLDFGLCIYHLWQILKIHFWIFSV